MAEKYPVDEDRIYTTGTFMGAMTFMRMMEEDPDLFAGAYLIAGQWRDTEAVKDNWNQNIFFLLSEDDPSCERAAANTATWKKEGAKAARAQIDVTDETKAKAAVSDILSDKNANIHFLSIEKGHGSADID